ncbi:hypothetical protein MRX96_041561 [Rhipicephalus microplus]
MCKHHWAVIWANLPERLRASPKHPRIGRCPCSVQGRTGWTHRVAVLVRASATLAGNPTPGTWPKSRARPSGPPRYPANDVRRRRRGGVPRAYVSGISDCLGLGRLDWRPARRLARPAAFLDCLVLPIAPGLRGGDRDRPLMRASFLAPVHAVRAIS